MAKRPNKAPQQAAQLQAPLPNQLDKFGLVLVILVLVLGTANIFVWDVVNIRYADVGMMRQDQTKYNNARPKPKVLEYGASAALARTPGAVDFAVLNKGASDGVVVGDVFVPAASGNLYIEFVVNRVFDRTCECTILVGSAKPTEDMRLRIPELVKVDSDELTGTWDKQIVRQVVHQIR